MGAERVAVADAGPIIHLHEIGQTGLLEIWDHLIVPAKVRHETVGMGRAPEQIYEDLNNVSMHTIPQDALWSFIQAFDLSNLHQGEIECLYLCKHLDIPLLLTDDLDARATAKRMEIQPAGSVGIIVKAWKTGRITLQQAQASLRDLQQISSLFITPEIIEIAIRQLT